MDNQLNETGKLPSGVMTNLVVADCVAQARQQYTAAQAQAGALRLLIKRLLGEDVTVAQAELVIEASYHRVAARSGQRGD